MSTTLGRYWAIAIALTIGTAALWAQDNAAPEIRIVPPEVRDQAVVVPAAFWNEGVASWLEVAISGRPSEFLHETLICIPTTQSDMIRAMHRVGFRNATDVAKNFDEFKQIRGDRALLLLEVTRDGKKETYMLEELFEFHGWGTSVGPLGFYFKGTPPGAASQPADPTTTAPSDAQKILMDDPQAALTFKGLQHVSRSFLDFSLAYDDWLYPPLEFARNTAVLPADVLNSNGKVPVTLIIKKITETQALEAVIQYWHGDAMKEVARQKLADARLLDSVKERFARTRDAEEKALLRQHILSLYRSLDLGWSLCSIRSAAFADAANDKKVATRFVEHLALQTQAESHRMSAMMAKSPAHKLISNSQADIASVGDSLVYWRDQKSQLDPQNDPRKDWVDLINLQIERAEATQAAAEANIKVAQATPPNQEPALTPERQAAAKRLTLAQLRLQLKVTQIEIARQQTFTDESAPGRIAELKALQAQIEKTIADTEKK